MDNSQFDELQQDLQVKGPDATIDRLCDVLREKKDYHNLFYALLLKKRHELGVNPIPTSPSHKLPEEACEPYEDGIRVAAETVGKHFLDAGDIAGAWSYYSMLGESKPVAEAVDKYQPSDEDEDCDAVINIAYHQGVHPRRGFDLILDRYGICSAITTLGGGDGSGMQEEDVRNYCVQKVTRALYEELRERLLADIAAEEKKMPPPSTPVGELLKGRFWLFRDDIFHVDVSHLGAVVQMAVQLDPKCEEFAMAREMCEYGSRLSPQFQYNSEPPFDNQYEDYGIYYAVLAGENVKDGLEHFRKKIDEADPEEMGTYSVEVYVNLLLQLGREQEALDIASQYLVNVDERQLTCPGIVELCDRTGNFDRLAELAKKHNNMVHYVAGLIAANAKK